MIGLGLRPLAHPSAGTPQLAYAGAQLAQQEGSERIATREPDRVIEVQWSHGSNPPVIARYLPVDRWKSGN